MNDLTLSAITRSQGPVTPGSPALTELISLVGEGANERDRDRVMPFEALRLVRQRKLGAFRLPAAQGGGGASLVQLFETVISLAEVDPNVTHIIRNHFAFVEKALRATENDPYRSWLPRVAEGTLIGGV